MAIAYLQLPPLYAAAFNPLILVVQTPAARYAQLEKDLSAATTDEERTRIQREMDTLAPNREQTTLDPLKILVIIGNNSANREVVIEREPDSEGKAVIDLSFIMRHAFINVRRSVYPYIEYDYNLSARYLFLEEDEAGYGGDVINAVEQLGHFTGGLKGFARLTRTPLVRYPGYPLAVTFLQTNLGYRASLRVGNETQTGYLPLPIGNVLVAGKEKYFDRLTILTSASVPVAEYDVATGCIPDAPFYIRWINTRGGWDYHMFERREETSEVGDISSVQRMAADPNDTQTTVSISASRTVAVGEGLLEREEYLSLSALARSPRIEWYDEELGAWQVIVLADDFASSWDARNAFGSVEFTFLLPRTLTQF